MKLVACPNCRIVHESVSAKMLDGADEERKYALTHCRLCETSSRYFRQLEPEVPDLRDDELGYPATVIEAALGIQSLEVPSE